jgi:MoaA/NifB/PqqE/SkfB family radical SAM enzyme
VDTAKTNALLAFYSISQLRREPPRSFDWLRFDPNNMCNVHCVYCHNGRSPDLVSTDDLAAFLDHNVISTDNVQVGCGMEPTLDPRLADLLLMIHASKARPAKQFVLQTNGILLHRHDLFKMRDAGLTHFSVSIDAADPKITKMLRGGTSLDKVHANLQAVQKTAPQIKIAFVTTVTSLNIGVLVELVEFGLALGVREFNFREMFYFPESDVVDHTKMPPLLLKEGEFKKMQQQVLSAIGTRAYAQFYDAPRLAVIHGEMKTESMR